MPSPQQQTAVSTRGGRSAYWQRVLFAYVLAPFIVSYPTAMAVGWLYGWLASPMSPKEQFLGRALLVLTFVVAFATMAWVGRRELNRRSNASLSDNG